MCISKPHSTIPLSSFPGKLNIWAKSKILNNFTRHIPSFHPVISHEFQWDLTWNPIAAYLGFVFLLPGGDSPLEISSSLIVVSQIIYNTMSYRISRQFLSHL